MRVRQAEILTCEDPEGREPRMWLEKTGSPTGRGEAWSRMLQGSRLSSASSDDKRKPLEGFGQGGSTSGGRASGMCATNHCEQKGPDCPALFQN